MKLSRLLAPQQHATATAQAYCQGLVNPGIKIHQSTNYMYITGADLGMLKGGVKVVFDMRCKVST